MFYTLHLLLALMCQTTAAHDYLHMPNHICKMITKATMTTVFALNPGDNLLQQRILARSITHAHHCMLGWPWQAKRIACALSCTAWLLCMGAEWVLCMGALATWVLCMGAGLICKKKNLGNVASSFYRETTKAIT
jgi:hypothetical protein